MHYLDAFVETDQRLEDCTVKSSSTTPGFNLLYCQPHYDGRFYSFLQSLLSIFLYKERLESCKDIHM
jgi:hypothetical protein